MPQKRKKLQRPKPLVLAILEGWGIGPAHAGNAISEADPEYFKYLISHFPALTLEASGTAVGLIPGREVTSEDGYRLIGGGRRLSSVRQRVNDCIEESRLGAEPLLLEAFSRAKQGSLHLVGVVSSADTESSLAHLEALISAAEVAGVTRIFVHAILDGRDAPGTAGKALVQELAGRMAKMGAVASLVGRNYALDSYERPARIKQALMLFAAGQAEISTGIQEAFDKNYDQKIFDDEFPPTLIVSNDIAPNATVNAADAVVFFNYEPLAMRPLAAAWIDFYAQGAMPSPAFYSLCELGVGESLKALFPSLSQASTLGHVISSAGLQQLRLSDSEGFAGVTAFLNGGSELPLLGEERRIIQVPLLEDYAEKPDLANALIAKEAVKAIDEKKADFIVVSFPSIDRLAHTANLSATMATISSVDEALKDIVTAALAAGGASVITSTHGLAEQTLSPIEENFAAHTGRLVPFLLVSPEVEGFSLGFPQPIGGDMSSLAPVGTLADVAPTILALMRLDIPADMDGKSLFDPESLL